MFWRLRQALQSFMFGRYGADKLYWVLMISWLLVSIVNNFVGSVVLYFVGLALAGFAIFRFLSRNIYKRQAENARFLRLWSVIVNWVKTFFARCRDIGKKRYRKCRNCRAVLRLPIRCGTHNVRCPKCGNNFKVTIII